MYVEAQGAPLETGSAIPVFGPCNPLAGHLPPTSQGPANASPYKRLDRHFAAESTGTFCREMAAQVLHTSHVAD